MAYFDSQRLAQPKSNLNDLSDAYGNRGAVIRIQSQISRRHVEFKAFITAYTETFSSDYASEQVFGRIDQIHTFKQTVRNCTLSFVIPAATTSEGFENLIKVDELRSFLYPSYTDTGNAITINQNPLVRISLSSLLTDGTKSNDYIKSFLDGEGYDLAKSSDGALSVINSLNVNFNLDGEAGVFDTGNLKDGGGSGIIPKQIDVAVDFSIIHERNMGQKASSKDKRFPAAERVYGTSNDDYGLPGTVLSNDDDAKVNEFYKQKKADEDRQASMEAFAAQEAAKDTRIAQFRSALRGRSSVYKESRSVSSNLTRGESLRAALSTDREVAIELGKYSTDSNDDSIFDDLPGSSLIDYDGEMDSSGEQ